MINNEDFANRLQNVIEFYGESASSFASKIGVQRSSISHILSGRNKPSLDFVLKVLSSFPEVDLYWLMNGKGNFPPLPNEEQQKNSSEPIDLHMIQGSEASDKEIERIVIFFNDGTFKNFQQK
ncbi:MAG: helix-turn-helix transcriptional regulator [Psychroserpens sp.]|nr:helix-turn-helix transcriptional regulator [Psychroserpens sp.]